MADNYGTVAGYRAYWAARGVDTVATTDDVIGYALLIGSEWIDTNFRAAFMGYKVGMRAQVREWPRYSVSDAAGYYVPSDSVPQEIERATYLAAFKQIAKPGIFYADYTPNKYKSVAISGAVSVEYAIGSAYDFQTQMPEFAAILAPLLSGAIMSSASTQAVRS